jgi:hypothetical protein
MQVLRSEAIVPVATTFGHSAMRQELPYGTARELPQSRPAVRVSVEDVEDGQA